MLCLYDTSTSTKFELKGLEVVTIFLFGSGLVELAVLRSELGKSLRGIYFLLTNEFFLKESKHVKLSVIV